MVTMLLSHCVNTGNVTHNIVVQCISLCHDYYRFPVDLMHVLETKYSKVLELITSRLMRLQEGVIKFSEATQLQSAYQDWKNQIIQLSSQQIIGKDNFLTVYVVNIFAVGVPGMFVSCFFQRGILFYKQPDSLDFLSYYNSQLP